MHHLNTKLLYFCADVKRTAFKAHYCRIFAQVIPVIQSNPDHSDKRDHKEFSANWERGFYDLLPGWLYLQKGN